jgi:hypothetical protein
MQSIIETALMYIDTKMQTLWRSFNKSQLKIEIRVSSREISNAFLPPCTLVVAL